MNPRKFAPASFVPSLGARRALHQQTQLLAFDDAATSSSFDVTSAISTPPPPGITPIQKFEPILNGEAAASFVIIAIVFALLQFRINAVSSAAQRRKAALEALRRAESLQLSASEVGADADRPTEGQVQDAKREYEKALRAEMELRTIVPGVRIVAPNDPKRDEEERAAAKRFLGWGEKEFGDEPDSDRSSVGATREEENEGMSNGAKALLFSVGSMLIALLWTLSLDPMSADQVFTALDSME